MSAMLCCDNWRKSTPARLKHASSRAGGACRFDAAVARRKLRDWNQHRGRTDRRSNERAGAARTPERGPSSGKHVPRLAHAGRCTRQAEHELVNPRHAIASDIATSRIRRWTVETTDAKAVVANYTNCRFDQTLEMSPVALERHQRSCAAPGHSARIASVLATRTVNGHRLATRIASSSP